MTYTYAYKTSDGTRHEAAMDAPSRDEVFVELRKRGIKPIKVVAADGAKANGELRGVRKRVVTLGALCLVLGAVVASVFSFRAGESKQQSAAESPCAPRHQIYGDPAVMQDFERGAFGDALAREADRMLAWFAQPGKVMCPPGTDAFRAGDAFAAAYADCRDPDIAISGSDSREVRELKQIVNGMRDELRAYLANGNGTARSYWRRLCERQDEEIRIYERTRTELEGVTNIVERNRQNALLRAMGLRTIPRPKAKGDE